MLERYLIPLAPYALLALVLIACLFMFCSFDRDIRRLKSRARGKNHQKLVSQDELQDRLHHLNLRLRDAEERASIPAQPGAIKPSLNLNRRNQVIRMSRRGQPASLIATSLSMPRKEVELLLKIHNLSVSDQPETAA
jgi:hypothetical protein